MKENRQAYEQLADRATLILTAITNEISEADTEKIKAMEENLSRLLRYVRKLNNFARPPDTMRKHAPWDQFGHYNTPSLSPCCCWNARFLEEVLS
jgi:hypothetical protein